MAWWNKRRGGDRAGLASVVQPDDATKESISKTHRGPGKVAELLSRFRKGKPANAGTDPAVTERPAEPDLKAFLKHEDLLIAFEISWQLLRDGQTRKLQAKALADGYTHQVIGLESDLVGFMDLSRMPRDKRPIYSAALLLAETSSLGGDEIFVFSLDGSRHAMVALKNSMPVPGFDRVGSAADISNSVRDYLSLPHKNEIRRCGDAEMLAGAEFFDFTVALNALDPSQPRLKSIPDFRKIVFRGALGAGAALLLVVSWMGWTYFEAKAEAERLQREGDPNVVYEQSFMNSTASMTALGNIGLRNMIDTLIRIPLEVKGWRFTSIACQPAECIVTWTRQSGSYADFDSNLPSDVKVRPEYGFLGPDAKGAQLKTRHPVTSGGSAGSSASAASIAAAASGFVQGPSREHGLKRDRLPLINQVQFDFVSRLQDYSLIDAKVQVAVPAPFPAGVTEIGPIFKPVVSGTWSTELPLWAIDSITVPDYVLVDALSLDLPLKDMSDKNRLLFKISGKYYAKGKDF